MLKKIIKVIGVIIFTLVVSIIILIKANVIWMLAPYYELTQEYAPIDEPIMDMTAYQEIWNDHKRPYIFSLTSNGGGKVFILGVDHTKDPNDPQLDSIRYYWEESNPDIALVEGKVGNLFAWFQDPILELGEGGLVTSLAHKKGIDVYSWEPDANTEIEILLEHFSKKQLAMYYSFRPYFSNKRYGEPEHPEAQLQDYLESRTNNKYLKGVITSWEELDKMWKEEVPSHDWRAHKAGTGFPDGYLYDIWNRSNIVRDEHMVQIILELVNKGKTVFVCMGSSHAPRIEKTLRSLIQ